jgi:hypothetical protein
MNDRLSVDALEDLGRQFAGLQHQSTPSRALRRRSVEGVRRVGLLVGVLLLATASLAIGAATGVFDRQPDGLVRQSEPKTIARGSDERFGAWSAVIYGSDQGLCLDVKVQRNISQDPLTSGSCGGSHAIAHDGGGPFAPGTFFYGLAPFNATKVVLHAPGAPAVTVPTYRVNPDVGAFFFVGVKVNAETARATPLDASGKPMSPSVFAP